MYPKHLINGSVESYKDLYHPSALPSINSAIEPNKGAKNHMFKALAFHEMFGSFPKALVIQTKNDYKKTGSFSVHYHYF